MVVGGKTVVAELLLMWEKIPEIKINQFGYMSTITIYILYLISLIDQVDLVNQL